MLGSKTLRLATVTAVASLLALPAFVGEAHAAAKAFSSLHVEDFIASEGGTQFDQGDFDNLGITNSGQNSATLTGFAGEVFGDAGAAYIDPDHAYVGNGCASIRSEEHTSELQSLMRISYAVFCLKKKNTIKK